MQSSECFASSLFRRIRSIRVLQFGAEIQSKFDNINLEEFVFNYVKIRHFAVASLQFFFGILKAALEVETKSWSSHEQHKFVIFLVSAKNILTFMIDLFYFS